MKGFRRVLVGMVALTVGPLLGLTGFPQSAYCDDSNDSIKVFNRLSKLEKKNYVNPILENLASTLEKNQSALQDVAIRLNRLVQINKKYKLGESERLQELKDLLDESKHLRAKFHKSDISLSDWEKSRLKSELRTEGVDSRVLDLLTQYEPHKANLEVYGLNVTGGLGVAGVSMGIGAGVARSILGKRDVRIGTALALLAGSNAGCAVSCGKVTSNSQVTDQVLSSVTDFHRDFAVGVGISNSNPASLTSHMPTKSEIEGFSIGIGGGEGSRKSGIIKLPIPMGRNYAELRNAIGFQYSVDWFSSKNLQEKSDMVEGQSFGSFEYEEEPLPAYSTFTDEDGSHLYPLN